LTTQVLTQKVDLSKKSISFWCQARVKGDCNKLWHLLHWPSSFFRRHKKFYLRGIRSCNLGVWRTDFFNVNGFDETFKGWGHEDADLGLRLSHLGISRKNGFMATEVFHLWHCEKKRDQELDNKNRVLARLKTYLVQAEKGLKELDVGSSVKISVLN